MDTREGRGKKNKRGGFHGSKQAGASSLRFKKKGESEEGDFKYHVRPMDQAKKISSQHKKKDNFSFIPYYLFSFYVPDCFPLKKMFEKSGYSIGRQVLLHPIGNKESSSHWSTIATRSNDACLC